MRDDEYRASSSERDGFQRLFRWLKSRPMESWGFFVAGIVIARILF